MIFLFSLESDGDIINEESMRVDFEDQSDDAHTSFYEKVTPIVE